jgi:flavodoxin
MKSLVIYDSYFGNTEKVAKIIAEELNTKAVNVKEFQQELLENIDLLIVGSPTRIFTSSPNIKNFLNHLPNIDGVKVAAFDARMRIDEKTPGILRFLSNIFGYAAEPMLKKLEKKGGKKVLESEGFYVKDTEGPLEEGEEERIKNWISGLS